MIKIIPTTKKITTKITLELSLDDTIHLIHALSHARDHLTKCKGYLPWDWAGRFQDALDKATSGKHIGGIEV